MREFKYFMIGASLPSIIGFSMWGLVLGINYAVANWSWWPSSGVWIMICLSVFAGAMGVITSTFIED